MKFCFFHIIAFSMLVIVATNAETLPPQLYWKAVLPNSPMPKAITNLLPNSPMPKAITNLLLPGVVVGAKNGYSGGAEVDVNSKTNPDLFVYRHAASESDVNSKKNPNWFMYRHAASESDVNSKKNPNWFLYRHAASESDVNSKKNPNWFMYHHAASESVVNSKKNPNLFLYRHAASESDVNSKKNPNWFMYRHAASESDVNSKKNPNLFLYRHAASESDVNSKKNPNLFLYRHAASESDVNSKKNPNLFLYRHAASESDVNSKKNPNLFLYRHAASESEVNSNKNPNLFLYRHAASESDVNSKKNPNLFLYRHAASESDVNSKKIPNWFLYQHAASEPHLHNKPNTTIFFFEKDLHHGTKSHIRFSETNSNNEAKFLPKQVAKLIPFSSKKMEDVLHKLNIKKGSKGALIVNDTINECEMEKIVGEEKLCVTSLESMIDFTTSKLGKNVEAVSTEMNKESDFQEYTIITQGVKSLGEKNKVVVCHKENYPYAVFYCHTTDTTKVYSVPLKGVDGGRVKSIVVCHTDTSKWNPKHFAFIELKVKVGTAPICHLLNQDHVAWISK